MPESRRLLADRVGLESLLELPKSVQRQALKKMRLIEAAPENIGYRLRGSLAEFRGIHSGRYRIIWRTIALGSRESVAEVCYVGIRSKRRQGRVHRSRTAIRKSGLALARRCKPLEAQVLPGCPKAHPQVAFGLLAAHPRVVLQKVIHRWPPSPTKLPPVAASPGL